MRWLSYVGIAFVAFLGIIAVVGLVGVIALFIDDLILHWKD